MCIRDRRIIEFASQNGFFVKNLEYSPIKGPEGNIEYLVYIRKDETGGVDAAVDIEAVVDAAHGELDLSLIHIYQTL